MAAFHVFDLEVTKRVFAVVGTVLRDAELVNFARDALAPLRSEKALTKTSTADRMQA
jgi:hypothetical protein